MNTAAALLNGIRFDYECPAVQGAIDEMASEFRDGRQGLVAYLRQESQFPSPPGTVNSVVNYILNCWQPLLELATGRPTDFWLR